MTAEAGGYMKVQRVVSRDCSWW